MHRTLLINEVRKCLHQKRYVIFFDDVCDTDLLDEMEGALIDNQKQSRIFITTRKMSIAEHCEPYSVVRQYNMQPLTTNNSLKLFYMKAFQSDYSGEYRNDLERLAYEIVSNCKGLPLAIVALAACLRGNSNVHEWEMFNCILSSQDENISHFHWIKTIFNLSYDGLSSHLKKCLLYFGIYPCHYEIKLRILIRQWIAEGFVKQEPGKTFEEVAEQYLSELVSRSLVQVSSISLCGKVRSCRVNHLLHEMILAKGGHLSFCKFVGKDGKHWSSGIVRRLSISTTSSIDSIENTESSHIRSLYFFTEEELPNYLVTKIPTKYKLLRVLAFENARLLVVPENLGDLIHLKYLSFRNTNVPCLPESIGKINNLETLDLRQTCVKELPKEIGKLRKLRHLLGNKLSLIHLMSDIEYMEFLQTLSGVIIHEDGIELITKLGKLNQLRKLSLFDVREDQGIALSSSINEMQHLEKLYIEAKSEDVVIDLSSVSNPIVLQKLRLKAKLNKLPKWIPNLVKLVELSLSYSCLIDDPLESLESLPNLLVLNLAAHSYEGKHLHFRKEGFKTLKELGLRYLYNLECITIEEGALHSLKELTIMYIPNLKVPSDIQYLENIEVLNTRFMPEGFRKIILETTYPRAKLVKGKKQIA